MKRIKFILVLGILLATSSSVYAQNKPSNSKPPTGAFPEASFGGLFEKNLPPRNDYSPFSAWRAEMKIGIVIYRSNSAHHEIYFDNMFQTIGTEKRGPKIKVAGTVYVFGANYRYRFSDDCYISGGVVHLSSHFAEDLRTVILDVLHRGGKVPELDASDLNVFFLEGFKRVISLPLEPEFRLRIQPVGFRFHGDSYRYNKPVYLATQATLLKGHEKRFVFATQHEFGDNGFNEYSVRLELFAKNQREGRFQVFVSYSPGEGLQISSNDGQHRNGFKAGLKLFFRTP